MAKKKQARVVLSRLPMRGARGETLYRVEKVTNRLDPPVGEEITEADVKKYMKLSEVTVDIVRPRH